MRRTNDVMVTPCSSMIPKEPPWPRYLAKTEKSGTLAGAIGLWTFGAVLLAAA